MKKHLADDDVLINRYSISVNPKQSEISNSELRTLLVPRPNSRFLTFRFKLWSYLRYQKKQSKFNKWLDKHFGEEPVLYNESEMKKITGKMERYLNNVGYFNSQVSFNTSFGRKTARIRFQITPAK